MLLLLAALGVFIDEKARPPIAAATLVVSLLLIYIIMII